MLNLNAKKMTTQEITMTVLQIENGDVILAADDGEFYVLTTDGIMIYNYSEMKEIYDIDLK